MAMGLTMWSSRHSPPSVNGQASGSTFVVFGEASGFAAKLSLGALTGANGFRINGAAAGDLRVRES